MKQYQAMKMPYKFDYPVSNSRLLQRLLVLIAGLLIFILTYWAGVYSKFYIAALLGAVFLAFIWWTMNILFGHINMVARELVDTKQHFEKRGQQRTREQEGLLQELKDQIAARRKIEEALTTLRKEEDIRQRKKLAAEMHDIIGQHLQSIKLLFKIQQAEVQQGKLPDLDSQEKLVGEIDLVIKHIRQMTSELHPVFLDTMNILQAIYSHNKTIHERVGLEIVIKHDRENYPLGDMIKEYCYLIYREVLNNVIKHAEATRVEVELSQAQPEWLRLEIRDNGRGFDLEAIEDRGHGLVLMQDRTRDIGGNLEIKSVPGEGTCVYIKIPSDD